MSEPSQVKDLTLLGNSENRLPGTPEEATLEVFLNRNRERNYWIELDYP